MHKLITAYCRTTFDGIVKNHLEDGWNVLQGTMYATVINTTREEAAVLTAVNSAWEDNILAVFLQGQDHQVLVTSQNGTNFDKFVNSYLEGYKYEVIPGTIYATALENVKGRILIPYISVVLQKY